MELRRNIHLALWHAMIACDDHDEARAILAALASIQVHCLADAAAGTEPARESTEGMFVALRQALPREVSEPIFAQDHQVVIAWQQSRRMH